MKPQTGTQNWLKPPNRQTIIDPRVVMTRNSVFLAAQFYTKRSQMQSSLPSMIVAVFKRNSVEYI